MNSANVLFAGFGGHGMLLAGKLLAMAAVEDKREVSWLPAYGAEMRGGTANVTVCISDNTNKSPYIESPETVVAMNHQSLLKFGPKVKPGGSIIVNSTLVKESFKRDDCVVFYLPAGDIAMELSSIKSSNIVLLGAYIGLTNIVNYETVIDVIKKQFGSKPKIVDGNIAAFSAGRDSAVEFINGTADKIVKD
ncbi:MAG: 2-oxoacid:acceptor oxidoreductase family protein [Deltaproteobacteria bacterium]|nr:2-oxoacid:acceptor oxidoreductase family protein [Deltaproteobacteria bacterium]